MENPNGDIQLASLAYRRSGGDAGFPFSVPAIATLDEIVFDAPVTLLVGENGAGKSTLLEALALAAELPAVGATRLAADPTLAAQRRLAESVTLVRDFLRAPERYLRQIWRER